MLRAHALLDLGRVAEAHAAATRAMAIDAKTLRANDPHRSAAVTAMADVLLAQRRFALAEEHYRQAITLHAMDRPADSPWFVKPLTGLCEALLGRGDRTGAAVAAERAVQLSKPVPPRLQERAKVCLARSRR